VKWLAALAGCWPYFKILSLGLVKVDLFISKKSNALKKVITFQMPVGYSLRPQAS
jgi:hypothetical protein